jgi:hypothetical protein
MIIIALHLGSYVGFYGSLFADLMIQYLHKLNASLIQISEEGRKSDRIM